ncbi:QueT transporter family protein [Bacillus mangrovi]|uniref:QueT transporter family protein n=1 Tax=Metabacillus mangrovi TaxID=1491830 RepID=A0A7X2S511_9BACI|nr:QueT transporter family protein [Metabacillus mangrovi]MTH53645.1 QueT transporter family protein [Metabacillus mangrovi]
MGIKTLTVNGILAALYIAVTALVAPVGFSFIQFRVSEILNHLVVFNKKYMIGIVLGVFISNLLFSPMKAYDLIFGTGQSLIALSLTVLAGMVIKNIWGRMIFNTLIFTFTMCIIAFEIKLAMDIPETFWYMWATIAAGEFIIMAIGMPVIYALNKRLKFKDLV